MIKDLCYTTPLLGAIRIGHVEERQGKRLPQKDDQFTITEPYKMGGQWVQHELDKQLKSKLQGAEKKLREIPIKVLYSDPDLNLTERYEAYDRDSKRLVCAGDGEKARRVVDGETKEERCSGDEHCEWLKKAGKTVNCGLFGRAIFKVEGQRDELGAFIMRYGSYNAVNSLRHKLTSLHALFGERLPYVPLKLVLRSKSSPISMNSIFYYADIELQDSPLEAAKKATAVLNEMKEAGINLAEFENQVRLLRNNGRFNLDPGETFEDREEFVIEEGHGVVVVEGQQEGQQGDKSETTKSTGSRSVLQGKPQRHPRVGGALTEPAGAPKPPAPAVRQTETSMPSVL